MIFFLVTDSLAFPSQYHSFCVFANISNLNTYLNASWVQFSEARSLKEIWTTWKKWLLFYYWRQGCYSDIVKGCSICTKGLPGMGGRESFMAVALARTSQSVIKVTFYTLLTWTIVGMRTNVRELLWFEDVLFSQSEWFFISSQVLVASCVLVVERWKTSMLIPRGLS